MKTILITGGSKGIGFAVAARVLREGHRVILLARNASCLEEARTKLMAAGASTAQIHLAAVDVGDIAALKACVEKLPWLNEGLDGLVNNAAAEILHRVDDFPLEDIDRLYRVNCLVPIVLIQLCLTALKKVHGSIVNIGSISDNRVAPLYSVYGSTKAFLNAFTKHAATELGLHGVRINLVSPGGIDTPLMDAIAAKHFSPEEIRKVCSTIPMEQRWGRPDEVADTVWFALFGPRYLHGADIRLHGGL
jgi:NAD(P)-dependent dehydrogenase (short-subunit alcohol dehydrogenase family)